MLNYSMFTVQGKSAVSPISVTMCLSGAKVPMEVDTGAIASVMNFLDYEKHLKHLPLQPTNKTLTAYGGMEIPVIGEVTVEITYGDQMASLPLYIVKVKDHAPPLLGRMWLQHLRLDWANLIHDSTVKHVREGNSLGTLLKSFQDVLAPGLGTVKDIRASLKLKENSVPVYCRPRPVPFALRTAVENELERMKKEGIIYPVDHSEWATPLVCVPKPDGTVRLCGDYKVTVNRALQIEYFPMPTPEQVFTAMANGVKFSKIDLRAAYQQLLLDEASQQLVTINTHKGLFRYTRLPYGIASSPAIWQRFVEQVLSGLTFTCVIMDDVLVSGANDAEHLRNVEAVLQRFRKYGLRVKAEKCAFMKDQVTYMGRLISAQGVQPTEDKVSAIKQAPEPRNVSELRSWLGMVNFQAQFIPHLSTLSKPLNDLLGKKKWNWSKMCRDAFQAVKDAISSETMLRHFRSDVPVEMACDASPYGVAAVIMQDHNGQRRPVAYASRSLNKHEQGYSQLDKEGLAVVFGLKRFHMYLYGRPITILTDNSGIEHIMSPIAPIPTLAAQRLQRWAIMLAAFDYQLKRISSKDNVLADALSRLPKKANSEDMIDCEECVFNVTCKRVESLPVTSKEIAHATKCDAVLSKVYRFIQNGWPDKMDDVSLQPYFSRCTEHTIEQDCILWGLRVIVPHKHQEYMLGELHVAHSGIVRMKEVARSFIWWPKIDDDIANVVRQCHGCQQVRNLPPVAPLTPWIWPGAPWSRIHIDFAEKDKVHYLVVTDAYSKWPEVVIMKSTTASATIKELRTLFAQFGFPRQVVSDNGPPFQSEEFALFMKQNGIKHIRVAPYHPSSNGAAERLVQTVKRSLHAGAGLSLEHQLAAFLLTYRSTKHATTGRTPSELFLGREIRTRLSLVRPDAEGQVLHKQAQQKLAHDVRCAVRDFYVGDSVYVKDLLNKNKWLLGTITQRNGPHSYVVLLQDGRLWRRHADHLRSAHVSVPEVRTDPVVTPPMSVTDSNAVALPPTIPTFPRRGESVPGNVPVGVPKSVPGNVPVGVPMDTSVRPVRVRKKPERLIETI
jgi:transposase InsO family protein